MSIKTLETPLTQLVRLLERSLPILRSGLNARSASMLGQVLLEELPFDAAEVTTLEMILATTGLREQHHCVGEPIKSVGVVTRAVATGRMAVATSPSEISCLEPSCAYSSGVCLPLLVFDKPIGTVCLYSFERKTLAPAVENVLAGFASLAAVQLSSSEMESQRQILMQSQLSALKAQIEPHFLFNVINAISAACHVDPEAARSMAFKLASLLRRLLRTTEQLVTVQAELDIVRDYVGIEKLRRKGAFSFSDAASFDALAFHVPILTIQPLIENAINHGPVSAGNEVRLAIDIQRSRLHVEVMNDMGPDRQFVSRSEINTPHRTTPGVGLRNVEQRLKTLFGDAASLTTDSSDGLFTVNVLLPLVETSYVGPR